MINLAQLKRVLPQQVLDIAEAIGMPATQELVEALGGTTWPVAQGKSRSGIIRHEALIGIIGVDAADIMAKHWANVPLYIPRCDVALRSLRDYKINTEFEQGVREGISANILVAELARSNKLSDRRIWEILKTPTQQEPDLFH